MDQGSEIESKMQTVMHIILVCNLLNHESAWSLIGKNSNSVNLGISS